MCPSPALQFGEYPGGEGWDGAGGLGEEELRLLVLKGFGPGMVEMLWALSSGVQQLELDSQDCVAEENPEVGHGWDLSG